MAGNGANRSFQAALAELAQLHEQELASQRKQYADRLYGLLDEIAMLHSRLREETRVIASEGLLALPFSTEEAATVQRGGSAEASSSNQVSAVICPVPDLAPGADPGAPPPTVSQAMPTKGPTGATPEDPTPNGASPTMPGPSSGASAGGGARNGPRCLWKIVGGTGKGGVLVQEGESLNSPLLAARLSIGAMIEEIELHANRLCFKRLQGSGPEVGWISTQTPNGRELAVRIDRGPLPSWQPLPAAEGSNSDEPLPIAIIFHQGMRGSVKALGDYHQWPELQAMLDKASPILGFRLRESQEIAIGSRTPMMSVLRTFAMLDKLKGERPEAVRRASAMAGSGFGQYLALYAAGVLSFEDALRLAMTRCNALIRHAHSTGHKSMMIAGSNERQLRSLCSTACLRAGRGAVCQISVYCNHDVFCVGGTANAVDLMTERAKSLGLWVGLPSTAAYNTTLMGPVQAEMAAALDEALPKMRPPLHTVWGMSALGKPARPGCDPAAIVADLKRELVSPFSVSQMVTGMRLEGINEVHIVGPAQKQITLLDPGILAEWETLWSEFVF